MPARKLVPRNSAGLLDPSGIDSARGLPIKVRSVQDNWTPFTPQTGGLDGDGNRLQDAGGQEDKLRSPTCARTWQPSALGAARQDTSTAAAENAESSCGDRGAAARLEARRAVSEKRAATAVFQHAAEGPQAGNAEVEPATGQGSWLSAGALRKEFRTRVPNELNRGTPKLSQAVFSEVAADGSVAGKEEKRRRAADAAVPPDWKPANCTHSAKVLALHADHPSTSFATATRQFLGRGSRDGDQQDTEQRNGIYSAPPLRQHASRRLGLHVNEARTGNGFGSELQRFFAALAQADHRLLRHGPTFEHRVQVANCTALQRLRLDEVTQTVYAELAAALRKQDPWEVRFREMEEFVRTFGRLPKQQGRIRPRRALGDWLCKQGKLLRANLLRPHRLHQLLNASPLVRERVERWISPDQAFERKCQELREHILATGSLPGASSTAIAESKLAKWLYSQARIGTISNSRRTLLESAHPLVQVKLRSWAMTQVRITTKLWQQRHRELLGFVSSEGRLPGRSREELRLLNWLRIQRRRFLAGALLAELALALQRSHPLIAEFFQRVSGDK